MNTKPPQQKILQGILHTENESKQNHKKTGRQNHRRRKGKKVETLIQLHKIKPLNNKENYMTGITTYLSILTLNINRINSPIKKTPFGKLD
jgi:hypothetical protein